METFSNKMNNTTMESLALPRDLYWDVKSEPSTPPSCQLFSIFEDLNGNELDVEDCFANDILHITTIYNEEFELKHDDIDFTQELIEEELVMALYSLKEENFYSPAPLLDSVVSNPAQVVKVQSPIDTNNFVFANQGASVFTSLTPPSSPPQIVGASPLHQALELSPVTATNLPISISDVLQSPTASEPTSPVPVQNQFDFANWNSSPPSTTSSASSASVAAASPTATSSTNYDIVLNTQIIDEILKTAANEFFEETESQSSVSGPSTADYASTDDEWIPSSGSCSPSELVSNEALSDCATNTGTATATATKKRTRPYGRGVEDRKKRKKEQNKNAATRYRQKKKLEMEVIQIEEQELNQRYEQLKRQLNEHKREAKYLRRLIREFYAQKQ